MPKTRTLDRVVSGGAIAARLLHGRARYFTIFCSVLYLEPARISSIMASWYGVGSLADAPCRTASSVFFPEGYDDSIIMNAPSKGAIVLDQDVKAVSVVALKST